MSKGAIMPPIVPSNKEVYSMRKPATPETIFHLGNTVTDEFWVV